MINIAQLIFSARVRLSYYFRLRLIIDNYKLMKNSIQKGSVRYIVFKEGDTWYGSALEFNIVEEAENPDAALIYLFEAIRGYINSAKKAKSRMIFALNQKPDPQYEKMWEDIKSSKEGRPIKSPYTIYTSGTRQFAHV